MTDPIIWESFEKLAKVGQIQLELLRNLESRLQILEDRFIPAQEPIYDSGGIMSESVPEPYNGNS